MTGNAAYRLRGRPLPNGPAPFTTLVELTWIEKRIECWIRFGQESYEQKLDRRRRLVPQAAPAKRPFRKPTVRTQAGIEV